MGYPRGADIQPNQLKYLKAPTYEQIMQVVNAHGVKVQQFERFYGIYITCIKQCRRGEKKLPPRYWHIIYEQLEKLNNNEPLPAFNPQHAKTSSMFIQKKIKKLPAKKRTTPIKKTGLISELL